MAETSRQEIKELTALRGLAAWWVVFHHFREYTPTFAPAAFRTFFDYGYLAVDLFFVMSGYIMMHVHAQDFLTLRKYELRQFLAKRFARIYPLHVLFLLAYLIIVAALMAKGTDVSRRFSAGSFGVQLLMGQAFTGNWGLYSWNVPSWSLSVEWVAYMAFPIAAWMIAKIKRASLLAGGCIALWITLGAVLWVRAVPDLNGAISEAIFRGLCQFLAGCAIYALHRQHGWAAWKICAIAAVAFAASCAFMGKAALILVLPPALFGTLMVAVQSEKLAPVSRVFTTAPLMKLGEWSFSTYMVHYYIRDVLKALFGKSATYPNWLFPAFLALVFVASIVVNRFFEVPARRKVFGWLGAKKPQVAAASA